MISGFLFYEFFNYLFRIIDLNHIRSAALTFRVYTPAA
ncbi:MAG: hypothetical protein RLZZ161_428, partial [Bacteroidota bacterium]